MLSGRDMYSHDNMLPFSVHNIHSARNGQREGGMMKNKGWSADRSPIGNWIFRCSSSWISTTLHISNRMSTTNCGHHMGALRGFSDDASPSPPSSLGQKSKWDHDQDEPTSTASIKRRLVRPKSIRKPDQSLISHLSSPGAGPSSPRPSSHPPSPTQPSSPESQQRSSRTSQRSPPTASTVAKRPRAVPPRSGFAPPRSAHPPLLSCRSVYNYTRLNHIEEGTYGVVFRAKCNETGGIYALKKLKLEEEKQGFPITSLREVMALMVAGSHENVVGIREIVVGDTLNQ